MLFDWKVERTKAEGGVPGMNRAEGEALIKEVEEAEAALAAKGPR